MVKSRNELVVPTPIETKVQVTSDDLVALLISQIEETIIKKERAARAELAELESKIKVLSAVFDDSLKTEGQKLVNKSKCDEIFKFLISLGIENPSIDVQNEYSNSEMHITVLISAGGKSVGRQQLYGTLSIPVPQQIRWKRDELDKLKNRRTEVRDNVLSLNRYRQTEMSSIERFARGQLAARTLKEAGGEFEKFVINLEGNMPIGLKNLLTE